MNTTIHGNIAKFHTFSHQTINKFKFPPTKTKTKFKLKTITTICHSHTSEHTPSQNTYTFADYIPGNNWWNLDNDNDNDIKVGNEVTVWHVITRIWGLVSDEKLVVYVGFCSLALAAVSEIWMPSLLASSIFAAQNGEVFVFYRNVKVLVFLCFVSGICTCIYELRLPLVDFRGLRSACFGIANLVLDISFYDREPVGNLTSRLGADCQKLSHIVSNNLHLIVRNSIQGIGALINLLTLSWPLALSACFICTLLCMIFLVYGRYQKKAAKLIQESTAHANEVSQETLSLVRTVRVNGTERQEHERYKQWLDKLALVSVRESAAYGLWNFSFNTLYRLTQVSALVLGGMSILTGQASAEQLTKYVLYCEWLIFAAWRLADNFSSLLQCVGASEKMSTLKEVNISIHPNEVMAIVGLSGSGKSTLIHLLLGLYEPTQGQILIDGHPLKDLDFRWLRKNIGYVGQEPHLFRMDIKSNISYGCSRNIKQEDIEWAAKQAYAHEFICSLPNGYETIVDDELLSGGQKQRIAIARAIVRDPVILILDEPTSALDAESEYYIQELMVGLKNDMKTKRSILFIAHRLSTVRAADRIVVMDNGQVAEVGDHKKLLEQNGLYARLHQFQTDVLPLDMCQYVIVLEDCGWS
ncbi:ABC transporter B family member 26, chloroplastic [Artemisia annua]|uniref:ABC transporter B family member 26, chloroplastic n=1 Tax=Artemisia annua TaxID=35608 RepID=A0A2U1MPK3_ARTAN|nr:ABC transporter B family member 26, chloroplastic [Artemisia annua]